MFQKLVSFAGLFLWIKLEALWTMNNADEFLIVSCLWGIEVAFPNIKYHLDGKMMHLENAKESWLLFQLLIVKV